MLNPDINNNLFIPLYFIILRMKSEAIKKLKKLTSKKHIFFTDRGNSSILLALKLARENKNKLYIQDQGGWLTYPQFAKKLKYEYHTLDTDYGVLSLKTLKNNLDENSVLLINSMPGYFRLQDNMKDISDLCNEKESFLINDISGSIGKEIAKYGNIIIGSFGRWKPINIEYGGFIAYDNHEYTDFFNKNFDKEVKDFYNELNTRLSGLDTRLKKLHATSNCIKNIELKKYNIDRGVIKGKGINVIVKFLSPEEEMKITEFCRLYNYEYTVCPRYIRVLDDAISIEVKRL